MHIRHQAVLLAEHWDGYPHRLRAISHLFEAEAKFLSFANTDVDFVKRGLDSQPPESDNYEH
jgi:hypothetical protein